MRSTLLGLHLLIVTVATTKGSTAMPGRVPDWCCDCRHPCRSSASRQESVRAGLAVGSSEASRSRGGRHTSSPDEDVAKSRIGSRLSHPFQEEKMRMTQGWTGLRTAVIALGLFAWCHQQAPRPIRILG